MSAPEAVVYGFVTEPTQSHALSDATFALAQELRGEKQVVDLTAVAGTYIVLAMLLAMAEQGVSAGEEPPFKPGEARDCDPDFGAARLAGGTATITRGRKDTDSRRPASRQLGR